MLNIPNFRRVALLIDADNFPLKSLEQLLKVSQLYGAVNICRAYGDWKQPPLVSGADKVRALKIETIQVDRIAKDTSDKRLMLEMVEIILAGETDLFIIASGDGDFRQLCHYIKEKGRKVVCIGNKNHSSSHLQEACDTFHYAEELEEFIRLNQPQGITEFKALCLQAFGSMTSDNDGWVRFDLLNAKLNELDSNFKNRFGHQRLSTWLKQLCDVVERKEHLVRKITPKLEPEIFDPLPILREAYELSKRIDGRANIGQMGNILRKLDSQFEKHFGKKQLVKWFTEYPQIFVRDRDHVSIKQIKAE